MNVSGVIINEAGQPFPWVKIGLLQESNNGYSIEDSGAWGQSDSAGMFQLYYPDTLDGKVLALFSPDGRSAAVYSPAKDYQGEVLTLDRAVKPFPWLLLALAAIAGYFWIKK